MPDSDRIQWASSVREPRSAPPATDQSGGGSSEESSLKTPVAVDSTARQSGYFDPPALFTQLQEHGSGTTNIQEGLPGRTSIQTSSGSLKAMADKSYSSMDSMRRALSQRSSHGQMRGRRPSHSKSASSSLPRRSPNAEHPTYPDQSFAALQYQHARPPLRTKSSLPAPGLRYNDIAADRSPVHSGIWTADNTPMSSPSISTLNDGVSPSDSLHYLQTPKETHVAEVDHDMYTGNKIINNYEVIQEIGRGEHGKVKLGRNISDGTYLVAIKIVPRFSKVRRLGRLGAPQDKTKKEVAILKKARHPHVVSLLEVIDDPSKNKVYLVLEYVDNGEIKWRKQGVPEIIDVATRRFEAEKNGRPFEVDDKDKHHINRAKRLKEFREGVQTEQVMPSWSLEHGGEEDQLSDVSRTGSRLRDETVSRASSHDDIAEPELAGTMYGSYTELPRDHRKFSIAMSAVSHLSSEHNFREHDEQDDYVPALTIEEARRAFRDTLLGLEFLHYLGIIHRDIKPANLLVTKDGRIKISDFGVSYLGRPISDEDPENKLTEKDVSALDDERELAKTVGTPAFWAPELCYEETDIFEDGKQPKIGTAVDLWALGITLFCMIYARLPFYATKNVGLHESVCNDEVFIPKYRLVPVDTTSEEPTARKIESINSNKRLDYELKFEEVPQQVRDLIKALLIKDPAKRMMIADAKKHPWVVEGMENKTAWLEAPVANKEEKARILDPDEKEVSIAVVGRNIINRAISSATKFASSVLGRKDKDIRKRSSSTATSGSHSSESSPAASNASTVGKGTKESRRQSLKPEDVANVLRSTRDPEHPLAQSQTASPETPDQQSYFESGLRPTGPDRGASALSTADSVRTIRAQQRPPIPDLHAEEQLPEAGYRLSIWEGFTARMSGRFSSRDRWSGRTPSPSRSSSDTDAHTSPSIAISTVSASGNILTPDALHVTSPVEFPTEELRYSKFTPAASTEEAFGRAAAINQRRHQQEAEAAEAAEAARSVPDRKESTDSCPPSPDDIAYLQKQRELEAGPSASTIASSVDDTAASSVSQNTSTHSFDMPSNASSPPTEGFLIVGHKGLPTEPEFMRTADTIKERPVARGAPLEERDEEGYEESDEDDMMMMSATKKK